MSVFFVLLLKLVAGSSYPLDNIIEWHQRRKHTKTKWLEVIRRIPKQQFWLNPVTNHFMAAVFSGSLKLLTCLLTLKIKHIIYTQIHMITHTNSNTKVLCLKYIQHTIKRMVGWQEVEYWAWWLCLRLF